MNMTEATQLPHIKQWNV